MFYDGATAAIVHNATLAASLQKCITPFTVNDNGVVQILTVLILPVGTSYFRDRDASAGNRECTEFQKPNHGSDDVRVV